MLGPPYSAGKLGLAVNDMTVVATDGMERSTGKNSFHSAIHCEELIR
jgi:hypothetical protein